MGYNPLYKTKEGLNAQNNNWGINKPCPCPTNRM